MVKASKIKPALTYLVCLSICFVLHILWHELIGHGLVGILAGGHITDLSLFCFRVFPEFGWSGIPGSIHIEDVSTPALHELSVLTGPLSTWFVALLAVVLLWVRRWTGLIRVILVCVSLWWYDLLSETFTAWGIPKYIFFYSRPPVHYDSAVWLGISGPLFHTFSIGTSVCLVAGLVICLVRDYNRDTIGHELSGNIRSV